MSVSAWTFTSAPRHGNMRLSIAVIQRVESLARRGLSLRSWKSAQLFAKEEVLGSQSATGMRRKENQADQINHDRRDCSEAVCNGSDQRKAWHERSG